MSNEHKDTISLYRWPIAKALQMLAEQLVVNPPDAQQRQQAADALNQIAESLMNLLTPQHPTEKIHARLMRESIAALILAQKNGISLGVLGCKSPGVPMIEALERTLLDMGYPPGCEFRARQTDDATRVEYPPVKESHQP